MPPDLGGLFGLKPGKVGSFDGFGILGGNPGGNPGNPGVGPDGIGTPGGGRGGLGKRGGGRLIL